KVGTAPIRMAELVGALEAGDGFAAERDSCILNLEAAAEQVRRWRARGLKIGFTNGCFDILHAGHVSYLGETRRHCDRLIVGLNNDSSVKILKGPGRPVHDEASRAVVLAALSAVDMVILFGAEKAGQDNTASGLIRALQPDVYFKGGDYRPDDIPEAPLVRAGGGEVLVMGHVEGQSTTKSQARIAGV
ncbi:MAG: adenylyltransferase/cytidyltransferase family protein, partial [Alphaproteobacteria bacterium]|nr:adenylyltransferase/cytidyltransferase family protein [Alphaproteobacteria bacterium]